MHWIVNVAVVLVTEPANAMLSYVKLSARRAAQN
jgi:hypothetical protein